MKLSFTEVLSWISHVRTRDRVRKKIDQTRHFSRFIAIQKTDQYMIICGEENGLITSPYCRFWQFCCWHDVLVLFQNPTWQAQTDMAVSLWVSQARYRLHLQSLSWPFCSDVVCICAHDFGIMAMLFNVTENAFFSCIYNPQIIISPTSLCTVSFNGNRVKNHPKPWTCPLILSYFENDCSFKYQLICRQSNQSPEGWAWTVDLNMRSEHMNCWLEYEIQTHGLLTWIWDPNTWKVEKNATY